MQRGKGEISEEEAKFLIQHFGSRNIRYGKELAGEVEDYIDIINDFKSDLNIYDLYPKICKEVKEEVEFVNYMVMRLVAWDREALTYFSESEEIGSMHITNINGALLKTDVTSRGNGKYVVETIYKICKEVKEEVEFVNYMVMRLVAWDREALTYFSESEEIGSMHITNINGALLKTDVTSRGNGKYVVETIYEDNDGYYFCKVALSIEKNEKGFKLNSMVVSESEPMYDFEVFDEISKEEFVDIYTVEEGEEFVEKFYEDNPFVLRSDMDEDAVFFTRFNFNNDHVKQKSYVINNDIKAIYYYLEGMFFVGTYSERDRDYINGLLKVNYKGLEYQDSMFFEQNALYDFVESGNDDFYDFLDE